MGNKKYSFIKIIINYLKMVVDNKVLQISNTLKMFKITMTKLSVEYINFFLLALKATKMTIKLCNRFENELNFFM